MTEKLQVDNYGRVVNISSSELIGGMTAPTKITSHKALEKSIDHSKARDSAMKEASSKVSVDFGDIKEYVDKVAEQHTNSAKPLDSRQFGQDVGSALQKAYKQAYKESNPFDGGMVKMMEKFYQEGLTGHSIHVYDWTNAQLLSQISKDIKIIGQHVLGRSLDPMMDVRAPDETLNNLLKDYLSRSAEKPISIPKPKEHTPTEDAAKTPPPPDTGHGHSTLDTSDTKELNKQAEIDSTLADATATTAGEIKNWFGMMMDWFKGNNKIPQNERSSEADVRVAVNNLKDVMVRTKTELKASEKAPVADFLEKMVNAKDNKLTQQDVDNITALLSRWYELDKAEKREIKRHFAGVAAGIESGGTDGTEKAENSAQKLSSLAGIYAKKDDRWFDKIHYQLVKLNNVVSKINPVAFGIGKEYSVKNDFRDAVDKTIREFGSDLHATLAQTSGLQGSIMPGTQEYLADKTGQFGHYEEADKLIHNFSLTGASKDDIRKTLASNLKKGITYEKEWVKLSQTGLATAKLTGTSAGETAEEISNWAQHLNLTTSQAMQLGRALDSVSKTTGVTGNNLMSAVKTSKQFADNMRNAGTYTDTAAENIIKANTAAQKKGMDKDIAPLEDALTSRTNLYKADPKTYALIMQAAALSGRADVAEKIQTGTLNQDTDAKRAWVEGLSKIATAPVGGKRLQDLSPQDLSALNMSFDAAFGKQANEIQNIAKLYKKDGGLTIADSLAEMKKELAEAEKGTRILTKDEMEDRRKKISNLSREADREKGSISLRKLTEAGKIMSEEGGGNLSLEEVSKRIKNQTGSAFDFKSEVGDTLKSLTEREYKDTVMGKEFKQKISKVAPGLQARADFAIGRGDKQEIRQIVEELQKLNEEAILNQRLYGLDKTTVIDNTQEATTRNFQGTVTGIMNEILNRLPERSYWLNIAKGWVDLGVSITGGFAALATSILALKFLGGSVPGMGMLANLFTKIPFLGSLMAKMGLDTAAKVGPSFPGFGAFVKNMGIGNLLRGAGVLWAGSKIASGFMEGGVSGGLSAFGSDENPNEAVGPKGWSVGKNSLYSAAENFAIGSMIGGPVGGAALVTAGAVTDLVKAKNKLAAEDKRRDKLIYGDNGIRNVAKARGEYYTAGEGASKLTQEALSDPEEFNKKLEIMNRIGTDKVGGGEIESLQKNLEKNKERLAAANRSWWGKFDAKEAKANIATIEGQLDTAIKIRDKMEKVRDVEAPTERIKSYLPKDEGKDVQDYFENLYSAKSKQKGEARAHYEEMAKQFITSIDSDKVSNALNELKKMGVDTDKLLESKKNLESKGVDISKLYSAQQKESEFDALVSKSKKGELTSDEKDKMDVIGKELKSFLSSESYEKKVMPFLKPEKLPMPKSEPEVDWESLEKEYMDWFENIHTKTEDAWSKPIKELSDLVGVTPDVKSIEIWKDWFMKLKEFEISTREDEELPVIESSVRNDKIFAPETPSLENSIVNSNLFAPGVDVPIRGKLLTPEEDVQPLLKNSSNLFAPAKEVEKSFFRNLLDTVFPKVETYERAEVASPETPQIANTKTVFGLDDWQRSVQMKELSEVQLTGPLNEAKESLNSIDTNTEKTAAETARIKELMQSLVLLLSTNVPESSNANAPANTRSNVKPSSPAMFWGWGLEGMNPNYGARRPNGLT